MDNIKTDQGFLDRLNQATTRMLSAEERHDQRVSFILSSVADDTLTKDQVERFLAHKAATTA